MRLIIAGGRDHVLTPAELMFIGQTFATLKVTEVVSGGATGADWAGEHLAYLLGIPVKWFKADWVKNGKAAGPIRNREMAQYADAVLLLPGGRGTANMREEAEKAGIRILDPHA